MKDFISKNNLFEMLNLNKINYKLTEHPALYTVNDSKKHNVMIPGIHSKNLFLKNKKNQYFLLSCCDTQTIDLKKLSKSLKLGNLSFVKKDKLYEILGVLPGSVSPFGLLNDKKKLVKFCLDSKITNGNQVNFHPLENTSTITLDVKDFIGFLNKKNIVINTIDYETYSFI